RKDVERALESISKEMVLEPMPAKLDSAAIEARFNGSPPKNPLPQLVELTAYQREKRLPQEKIEQYMKSLLGPDAAKVMLEGSEAERAQLLAKWLPKQGL
ncbi:MAG TPA: hypothetical protein VHV08_09645, partial [Pirellulales bacterium]|nr:hypothetical protein [Pirellulales bacterium]